MSAAEAAAPIHVLLVDDHFQLRRLLAQALTEDGFSVTTADTADQALKLLQGGLTPRLLLSDVRLPGQINGLQLARSARQILPAIAVLLQTGYTDLAVTEFRVLLKPYSPTELSDCLRAVLSE